MADFCCTSARELLFRQEPERARARGLTRSACILWRDPLAAKWAAEAAAPPKARRYESALGCYNASMLRIQVQLPELEHVRLRSAAKRMDRSISDCVREGIELFLSRSTVAGDDFSDIAGRFKPLPCGDASAHDAQWTKAIRDSKRSDRRR